MQMLIMMVLSGFCILCFLVFLILSIVKKKKGLIIAAVAFLLVAIAAFVLMIIAGNRYARDYNDGPDMANVIPADGDVEYTDIDYTEIGPTGYSIALDSPEETDSAIATLPLEIYMTVTAYDASTGKLTVIISNQSGSDMFYGEEYSLQKLEGEEWVDVEPVKEYGWNDVAREIKDLEEIEEVYDLSVFGELGAGKYRLCKTDLYAEFGLHEEWYE